MSDFRRELTLVRQGLTPDSWDAIAAKIAADRHEREANLRDPPPVGGWRYLKKQLDEHSWAALPIKFEQVEAVRKHLMLHPVQLGSHFDNRGPLMRLEDVRGPFACYRPDQFMRAPSLLDQVNDPRLLDLIEAYLGCTPTLYSLNAWWSLPSPKPEYVNVQYFHRDTDDFRFLVLFIYLTDVDGESGPHQIVPGSHDPRRVPKETFVDSMGVEFSEQIEKTYSPDTIAGPAGTMFLANTVALHRGLVPKKKARLILWARYGLGPNTNSVDNVQGPYAQSQLLNRLKDTPRNRYVNRLIIDFDR